MCLLGKSEEVCEHPECNLIGSLSFPNLNLIDTMSSIVMLLVNRNNILINLSSLTHQLCEKSKTLTFKPPVDVTCTKPKRSNLLANGTYDFKIVITGQIPNIVLKEKGFSIVVEVKDNSDNSIYSDQVFKVRLFTSEPEPKPLKLNIASRKIIRGTLETKMSTNNLASFDNIVINEVSSHYINESFILVVSCDSADIKPLVIENLCVRARNSNKKE